ncbi:hypothetical protein VMT65_21745 [Nocardia sp. CDC153]|uniref:hypothetical protein n=1 Tax=Nocardia sp. CDC153 TaxID=3112167 RepID=UPI002DB6D8F5|nr:hypothetical protein [Nocardia sp. CDC153]MEC3955677.1 hypothetical protein [Nocardia sp. CDC153]
MSDFRPHHLIRNLRERRPSGPRSRLRVVTLNHPLLDPGIAYWVVDDAPDHSDSGVWADD